MKKRFEAELPAGYKLVKTVDATDKKTVLLINIFSAVIGLPLLILSFCLFNPFKTQQSISPVKYIVFIISLIAYVVLHELVHGLVYKVLTRRKLTFGLTLSVAYCGVPDIYVYRTTAMLALLAPFVVFTVLFSVLLFVFPSGWNRFLTAILMSIHISGCVGDLYDTLLYLFKFKDPAVLMQDTGPKQSFYELEK